MNYVFYFTADWCQPCQKVRPIVEEMKRKGLKFQLIDVDYQESLVKQFEIKSVPTFILLNDGREINRITGAKTKEELESFYYEKTIQENI